LKGRCQEISFDFGSSPLDMQWKGPELKVRPLTTTDLRVLLVAALAHGAGSQPHRSRNRRDRQREMQGVDSMPENLASQQQSAKHLAARAVMAYRAGFPVALLSVASSSEHASGIVSDWKSQRDSFHNDAKLLARAFAFVYVGSIWTRQSLIRFRMSCAKNSYTTCPVRLMRGRLRSIGASPKQ
jgi:hypothetical protein